MKFRVILKYSSKPLISKVWAPNALIVGSWVRLITVISGGINRKQNDKGTKSTSWFIVLAHSLKNQKQRGFSANVKNNIGADYTSQNLIDCDWYNPHPYQRTTRITKKTSPTRYLCHHVKNHTQTKHRSMQAL